jgi:hypothetical protein
MVDDSDYNMVDEKEQNIEISKPLEQIDYRYKLYLDDAKQNGDYKEFFSKENYKCILQRNHVLKCWYGSVIINNDSLIYKILDKMVFERSLHYLKLQDGIKIFFDCAGEDDFVPIDLEILNNLGPLNKIYRDYNYTYELVLKLSYLLCKVEKHCNELKEMKNKK